LSRSPSEELVRLERVADSALPSSLREVRRDAALSRSVVPEFVPI